MRKTSPIIVLLGLLITSFQCHAKTTEIAIKDVGTIRVNVEKFETGKHQIVNCGDYTCLIDGSPFFGSDGKVPAEEITRISFIHKDFTTDLDVRGMYDPLLNDGNIKQRIKTSHYWGQFYKVTGRFSDGAGTYVVQWIVTKGGSIRTHISDMENLYELFKDVSKE